MKSLNKVKYLKMKELNQRFYIKAIVLLALLLLSAPIGSFAQTCEVTLRNDSLIDANNLIVDIYVKATGGSFYYAGGQYKVTFDNSSIANGGTITGSIVAGYSDLTNTAQIPTLVYVLSSYWRIPTEAFPSSQASCSQISATGIGTRICRVKLTNTIAFDQSSANMALVTTTPSQTAVWYSADDGSAIEAGMTMVNTNLLNPLLNGTITTYNVTGGGTEPAPVGLNGSQSDGVNYLLYRNGAPLGSPVDGTGSAISFGDQSEGTYTVKGHRKATYMYSDMAGSATVTSACDPVSITSQPANTSMCAGTGSASFSVVTGGTPTFGYQWQYTNGSGWGSVVNGTPAGATYTNAATATLGVSGITATGSYQYRCYVTNCEGANNATSNTATLTVNTVPATPGSVSGTVDQCQGLTGQVYSISAVTNATTYTWTVPGGWTITGGQGTTSVTVTTGSAGQNGNISVTAGNSCGNSSPSSLAVTVLPGTPARPGAISGTTAQCPGLTGQVYSINPVTDATKYNWTVPAGWTITDGQGAISITVTTGSSGQDGNISVTAENSCGTSEERTLSVTVGSLSVVPTGITITNNSTCNGVGKTITVSGGSLGAGATWQWFTVSCGGTTAGTGTSIIVDPPAGTSTTYYVRASGNCNTTACATGTVTVLANVGTPSPPSPSGTSICQGSPNTTYTTTAANATGYNWSVSGTGNTISGTGTTATVQWSPSFTGVAVISVTANGCNGPSPAASTTVTVYPVPSAPTIGPITQPSCTTSVGSVVLNGLPASGTWTVYGTPGGIIKTGTGTSTTISNLLPNTYTFTVEVAAGCTSPSSANVVISPQPPTPTPPVVGAITPPTCTVSTGSVELSGLPSEGEWTLTRYPGTVQTKGTGTSAVISGIPAGTHNYTVTNQFGCTSLPSSDVNIPEPPPVPAAPQVGAITHPTCDVATGIVVLSGLPSGSWTLLPSYSMAEIGGSGSSTTVTGVPAGTHTYKVTNQFGCTSPSSANVVINAQPPTPTPPVVGTITQPTCVVATGSVVLSGLPSGGTWTVIRNPGGVTTSGTGTSTTITGLPANGTYKFTVTNASGCTSPESGNVVIGSQPPSPETPVFTIDCSQGAGKAIITITSPLGSDIRYSLDNGPFQASTSFNNVLNGPHFISVRNSLGCVTVSPTFSVSCGCANPPTVTLSSTSGSTCGTTAITVSGNTFGGSATSVTLAENGAGTLVPASTSTSPFSFIYTPASGDIGKVVTITVTTNNPLGAPCIAASATYTLTVNAIPAAPSIGTRTHPTCLIPTGSVILNGLPATGTWTLNRSPDGVITTGTGTSTTVTGLNPGTYTFTVTTEAGCTSPSSANVVINAQPPTPTPPVIGTITQPTCATSTGSVVLTGLPSSGTWTVTRTPGGVTRTGTGTSITIINIPAGTFTFTVTNSFGCVSGPSAEVVINTQPPTPTPPSVGTITPPTCTESTGSVVLLGLPSSGTWTLTRYPGTITTTGTGTTTLVTGLASGTYNFTVTNQQGCTSLPSANVFIPAQPPTPTAPVIGTITQPTYTVPTGSVVLSGLPSGTWTITRYPGEVTTTGSGSSRTITGLPAGVFTFTVTNSFGCTSPHSVQVIISTPGIPTLIITDPPAVCSPATVDITNPDITAGSTPGLTYTYWTDPEATNAYPTPGTATTGTYYIKGTTVSGFFNIQPVNVIVDQRPVADAGPDQILDYILTTILEATPVEEGTGTWSVLVGSGTLQDVNDPVTTVTGLTVGRNEFLWTVVNGVCPAVSDKVIIQVNDLVVPTLITPNMDGRNDYFVLRGIENLGKTELIIFDRRGLQVYKNSDYNNDWDGVDYNNNPLPDDTYFYVLKASNGRSMNGYVVIRR